MPGYDYEFETEPDPKLLCGVCRLVMKDCIVSLCCGQSFCADCIFQWLSDHLSCPCCQEVIEKHSLSLGDIYTRRRIKNLRVICRVCHHHYSLHKIQTHESTCRRTDAYEVRETPAADHHEECPRKTLSGKRCKVLLCSLVTVCLLAAGIVTLIFLRTTDKPLTPVLSGQCYIGGDPCNPAYGGRSTKCDLATSTCLLTVGQDCSGLHSHQCVTGAICYNNVTDVCWCGAGYQQEDDICMLLPGGICSGGMETMCMPNSDCDLSTSLPHRCQCWPHFHTESGICKLKAGVATVNCSTVDACVEHATCDAGNSFQCECDSNYRLKSSGLCGLALGASASCNNYTSCVDYATCDIISNQCVCKAGYGARPDGTCGLKIGTAGNCSSVAPCTVYAVCNLYTSKCQCSTNFIPASDGSCVLKGELLGVDCRQAAACVEHATCDVSGTKQCLCDVNYSLKSSRECGLSVGAATPCDSMTMCVDHATCDVNSTNQCTCDAEFLVMSNGKCGLRVGASTDCMQTSGCVEHAICDAGNTRQCVCRNSFLPSPTGACGLKAGSQGVDCRAAAPCVEHATCNVAGTPYECVCDGGFSLQSNGTCAV